MNHVTECVLIAAKTDDHGEDDDKKEAGASDTEHPYSSSLVYFVEDPFDNRGV